METQATTDIPSTHNYIFLSGKQLAEVLDVSAPSLSEAAKKGYNCAGYPVCEWAIEKESGRIKGYDVPEFLLSGNHPKPEKQTNLIENAPNKPNIRPNKGQKAGNQTQNITHNTYSLLPQGEDYVRPAGMITLPLVLKKALDKDTPQSRAVIGGMLALLGAITGHAVTDNATGAGVGAGAGLGIALLMYKYFSPAEYQVNQLKVTNGVNNKPMGNALAKELNQSGFLPN